jgi:phage terminase large subunit-like protein
VRSLKAELLDRLAAEREAITDQHELIEWVRRVNQLTADIKEARWRGYAWQRPHTHADPMMVCGPDCETLPTAQPVTHGMWLMLGGRGTGKTEGAARYVNDHAKGPPCDPRLPGGHRMLIVAPTQGDAMDACYAGPSGLKTLNPTVRLWGGQGGTAVIWPTDDGKPGARARLLGAYSREDIERLRSAGNTCLVWMEEVAAQRYLAAALDHTRLGLRIGDNPHYVGSTTPKPRQEIRSLVAAAGTILTKGRTRDAFHLDPSVRQSYFDTYEGTRTGLQELDALLLDDVEGALWTYALIDDHRHRGPLPPMDTSVVGLDPPGSHKPGGAEAGIIVAGVRWHREDQRQHGYVISDLSGAMGPEEWARTAIAAHYRHSCAGIAAETTYGGEMVVSTIRTVDPSVPIFRMPTKAGKAIRAEPVVGLYEQARVHHVGALPGVETQMTEWVPTDPSLPSPDRIDALVHALTFLMVKAVPGTYSNPARTPRRIDRGRGR